MMEPVGNWFYQLHRFLFLSDDLGDKDIVEPEPMGRLRKILLKCQQKAIEDFHVKKLSKIKKTRKRGDPLIVGQPKEYADKGEMIQMYLHQKYKGNWEKFLIPGTHIRDHYRVKSKRYRNDVSFVLLSFLIVIIKNSLHKP